MGDDDVDLDWDCARELDGIELAGSWQFEGPISELCMPLENAIG